jgi:hypothetical protein
MVDNIDDERELAGAIESDIKIKLALGGPGLGDVDVEAADRISLQLLLRRPAAFNLRQSVDAVALKAAMRG